MVFVFLPYPWRTLIEAATDELVFVGLFFG